MAVARDTGAHTWVRPYRGTGEVRSGLDHRWTAILMDEGRYASFLGL